MSNRFVLPAQFVQASNGAPYDGAKLFFYESGTTTPLDTYRDANLTMTNANPVVANSAGRFVTDIFLRRRPYKVVLTDSRGNTVWSKDPVNGSTKDAAADEAFTSSGVATVDTTIGAIAKQFSARAEKFGTACDDETDDTPALQAAIDAASTAGGGTVVLGASVYCCKVSLRLPGNVALIGAGRNVTTIRFPSFIGTGWRAYLRVDGGNTRVSDLTIKGPHTVREQRSGNEGRGIDINVSAAADNIHDVVIERVSVIGCDAQGIIFGGRTASYLGSRLTVRDCVVQYAGDVGYQVSGGEDVTWDNCVALECPQYGFDVESHATASETVERVRYLSCRAINCYGGFISYQTGTSYHRDIAYIGCHASGSDDPSASATGVYAHGYCVNGNTACLHRHAYIGCTSYSNNGHGFRFVGQRKYIYASGCEAKNNGQGVTGAAGFYIPNFSNVTIYDGIATDDQDTATQDYAVYANVNTTDSVLEIQASGNGLPRGGAGSIGPHVRIVDSTDYQASYFSDFSGHDNPGGEFLTGANLFLVWDRAGTADSRANIVSGIGSPEGVVFAPPGSLYLNLSGGDKTSLYVKETGSSTTGWVAK